ncbi:MAG: SEC-C metal-binding domain-containing protein [Betaproteobacteria bacterium]
MAQRPDWERFRDPWSFYAPAEIERRQQRWEGEDAHGGEDELEDSDLFAEEPIAPHFRKTPKIGRNDPCPCGSGKKYKKCCLRAE